VKLTTTCPVVTSDLCSDDDLCRLFKYVAFIAFSITQLTVLSLSTQITAEVTGSSILLHVLNHLEAMCSWIQGERKLRTAKATDPEPKLALKLKQHWEKSFEHIITAILYLAEHNSALKASFSISSTAHKSYFRA
jgi:hypothetical protein